MERSFKEEVAGVFADLAARIGALEMEAASYKETITKQSEQIKKFTAQTPGAKSITLNKTEVKMSQTGRSLAGLEAAAAWRNRNGSN